MKLKSVVAILLVAVAVWNCTEDKRTNKVVSVSGISIDSLVNIELDQPFIRPVFGAGDSTLYFTQEGYKGIYKHSLKSNTTDTITNLQGAGYNYIVSGSYVFFIGNNYDPVSGSRSSSIYKYDSKSDSSESVYDSGSKIYNLSCDSSGTLSFITNDSLKYYDVHKSVLIKNTSSQIPVFQIKGGSIAKYSSESKISYSISKNNIVWLEVIGRDSLLVDVAGEGLFLYDLTRQSKNLLCDCNFPKWNNKYKIFASSTETNDSHQILSSKIFVGSLSIPLLLALPDDSTNVFYENPAWSNDGSKLAFNTFDWKIKIAYLSYR